MVRLRRRRSRSESPTAEPVLNLGSTASRPRDAERRTRRRPRPLGPIQVPDPGIGAVRLLLVAEAQRQPDQVRWPTGTGRPSRSRPGSGSLLGLELGGLRQLHFVVAEHWSGYYRFWKLKGVRPGREPPVAHGPVGAVPHRPGAADPVLAAAVRRDHRPVHRPESRRGPHRAARPPPQLAAVGGSAHHLPVAADQPVRAAVLVPVPGRGGDLLPRRHRHPASTTCGARTRSRSGCGRT